ncbi:MAG TPA: LysM domain-containing protein [Bacillales bacterium]
MKGFLGLCLAALVIYTIYYDLEYGTLPQTSKAATVQSHKQQHEQKKQQQIPSKKVKVKPGQTVLSVVEQLNGSSAAPIQKIVHDFKQLNPDTDANQIQIGQTYRFPIYKNE